MGDGETLDEVDGKLFGNVREDTLLPVEALFICTNEPSFLGHDHSSKDDIPLGGLLLTLLHPLLI